MKAMNRKESEQRKGRTLFHRDRGCSNSTGSLAIRGGSRLWSFGRHSASIRIPALKVLTQISLWFSRICSRVSLLVPVWILQNPQGRTGRYLALLPHPGRVTSSQFKETFLSLTTCAIILPRYQLFPGGKAKLLEACKVGVKALE